MQTNSVYQFGYMCKEPCSVFLQGLPITATTIHVDAPGEYVLYSVQNGAKSGYQINFIVDDKDSCEIVYLGDNVPQEDAIWKEQKLENITPDAADMPKRESTASRKVYFQEVNGSKDVKVSCREPCQLILDGRTMGDGDLVGELEPGEHVFRMQFGKDKEIIYRLLVDKAGKHTLEIADPVPAKAGCDNAPLILPINCRNELVRGVR